VWQWVSDVDRRLPSFGRRSVPLSLGSTLKRGFRRRRRRLPRGSGQGPRLHVLYLDQFVKEGTVGTPLGAWYCTVLTAELPTVRTDCTTSTHWHLGSCPFAGQRELLKSQTEPDLPDYYPPRRAWRARAPRHSCSSLPRGDRSMLRYVGRPQRRHGEDGGTNSAGVGSIRRPSQYGRYLLYQQWPGTMGHPWPAHSLLSAHPARPRHTKPPHQTLVT